MESANFDQLEKTLAEHQFLGGQLPTAADKDAFEQVKNAPPTAEAHPHTFAWFTLIHRFHESVRNSWGAAAGAPAKGAAKAKKEEPKKEEPKKEAVAAADDELDLFGDSGPSEEEKALLEAQKKKAEEAKKAKGGKPGLIAKSLILFDVKPYEAETDLDKLFERILTIEMDGLVWKQDCKKEPIAFGVHKLVVGCVIEDEKVSVDDLQEKIQEFEDEVQSVDIAVFNKI